MFFWSGKPKNFREFTEFFFHGKMGNSLSAKLKLQLKKQNLSLQDKIKFSK